MKTPQPPQVLAIMWDRVTTQLLVQTGSTSVWHAPQYHSDCGSVVSGVGKQCICHDDVHVSQCSSLLDASSYTSHSLHFAQPPRFLVQKWHIHVSVFGTEVNVPCRIHLRWWPFSQPSHSSITLLAACPRDFLGRLPTSAQPVALQKKHATPSKFLRLIGTPF